MKQIWSEFEMDLKKLEADVKRIWSQCEANLKQIRSKCETNRKPGSELKRIIKKNVPSGANWNEFLCNLKANIFFSEANFTEVKLGDNPLLNYNVKLPFKN